MFSKIYLISFLLSFLLSIESFNYGVGIKYTKPQSAILRSLTKDTIVKAETVQLSLSNPPSGLNKSDNNGGLSIMSARGLLLFVSALYGTNFGCVKILGEALEPSFAAAVRFSVAASIFAPYLIMHGSKRQELVKGGVEVGIYAGIGYWAQAVALQTSHASTAAFICSLAVVVVPILDKLFGKKTSGIPWYNTFLPAILAASGVACLELGDSVVPAAGDAFAFLQPIFFGLAFWRVESHMGKNLMGPDDPKVFTGAMMLAVATFAMVWSAAEFVLPGLQQGSSILEVLGTQGAAFADWRVGAAILWTGVVTTALTTFGENLAMRRLSAAESTIIYSTEPLWGAAFAAVALGEELGWNTALGALLILCACVWSSLGPSLFTMLIGAGTTVQTVAGEEVAEVTENVLQNLFEIFRLKAGLGE